MLFVTLSALATSATCAIVALRAARAVPPQAIPLRVRVARRLGPR